MPRHDAIVVAIHHSGEATLVVELLTEDSGRLSCVARGARKSRQRFPSGIDVLTRVDADETPPRRGELHDLSESVVTDAFLGLRKDTLAFGRAAYAAELSAAVTPRGHAGSETFGVLVAALGALSAGPCGPALLRWIEVRLLTAIGELAPTDRCTACGAQLDGRAYVAGEYAGQLFCSGCGPDGAQLLVEPAARLLGNCVRFDVDEAARAEATELTSVAAGRFLAPVIEHAVGRPLRSRRFLAQLQRRT